MIKLLRANPLFNQAFWTIISLGVNYIGRFISISFLWRSITIQEKHDYPIAQLIAGLVIVLADLGLENTIIRFWPREKGVGFFVKQRLKTLQWGIFALIMLACGIAYVIFHTSFAIASASIATFFFARFQILGAFFRANLSARQYTIYNTIRNGLTLAIIASCYYTNALNLNTWYLAQAAALIVLILPLSKLFSKIEVPKTLENTRFSTFSRFTLWINFFLWLELFWDILLLQKWSPQSLPSWQLIMDYTFFFGAVNILIARVWPAVFFTKTEDNMKQNSVYLEKALLLGTPAIALFFFTSPIGFQLITGTPSAMAMHPALLLVLGNVLLIIMISLMRPYIEYQLEPKKILIGAMAAAFSGLLIKLILIPTWGITGAGFGGMISYSIFFWILFSSIPWKNPTRMFLISVGFQILIIGVSALL